MGKRHLAVCSNGCYNTVHSVMGCLYKAWAAGAPSLIMPHLQPDIICKLPTIPWHGRTIPSMSMSYFAMPVDRSFQCNHHEKIMSECPTPVFVENPGVYFSRHLHSSSDCPIQLQGIMQESQCHVSQGVSLHAGRPGEIYVCSATKISIYTG